MHVSEHTQSFYLKDRSALDDATRLMRTFGEEAEGVAAAHAVRSRENGNLEHFCHWRQIERAIAALRVQDVTGTVH